jgi:hypothetical protein
LYSTSHLNSENSKKSKGQNITVLYQTVYDFGALPIEIYISPDLSGTLAKNIVLWYDVFSHFHTAISFEN